jgi:hypothetical protein
MSDFPNLNSTVAPLPVQKSYLTPFPTKALIADLKKLVQKGLTSVSITDTTVCSEERKKLDATTRKLVQRVQELELQKTSIDRELRALMTALTVAGVKPSMSLGGGLELKGGIFDQFPTKQESAYISKQLFADMSLRKCCEIVLREHKEKWLSKAEIEYLIVRGGYAFSTSNSKGSVGITLRRMAEEGLCEVQRARGTMGNRYRFRQPTQAANKS